MPDEDRSDDSTEENRGPSWLRRRRVLRTTVNLGASAALVFGAGAEYATSDDLGTITYAMARPAPGSGPLEPRTKEVPAAWHQSLRIAFEAQAKIREAGLSALLGSFVVPGSYGRPEASLSVDATDETVMSLLEELTDEVAVDLNVVDEIPPTSDAETDPSDAYRLPDPAPEDVPGGVVCEGSDRFGTLTPALFDAETGARYFATSNHIYGEAGTKGTEHRGEPLTLPLVDGAAHVGNVDRGYPTADVVRVTPTEGFRPASSIDRAFPARVVGQFTRSGLADQMARDESLVKLGALSDRTTGRIEGIDGVTCYSGKVCKSGQLKWGDEGTLTNGDSGSVNFRPDPENPDDYLLVGGINNARTWWPGADFAWGTAGHRLLSEFGLHF